jgi:hypothetical protein
MIAWSRLNVTLYVHWLSCFPKLHCCRSDWTNLKKILKYCHAANDVNSLRYSKQLVLRIIASAVWILTELAVWISSHICVFLFLVSEKQGVHGRYCCQQQKEEWWVGPVTSYLIVKTIIKCTWKVRKLTCLFAVSKLVDVRVYSATLRFSKELCRRPASLGHLSFVKYSSN